MVSIISCSILNIRIELRSFFVFLETHTCGNFNKAITKQAEKTKPAMYEVLKRGRTHNLSFECQLELFDKMVKPMLLYWEEIWGFSKNIDCLEKIQLRFCKLLLKLKSSTPNYMIYGELGRFPIEIDINIRMVLYWGKKQNSCTYHINYYTCFLLKKLFTLSELNI